MTDEQIRDVVHLARQKWQEEWTYTLEDIAAILADHSASQDEQSTGICIFCGEPIDGKHESDCPQASPAASSAATVSDAAGVALTDERIIDIWCNTPTTRFGGEVEDQEIIDFARALLAASSAATVSDAASVEQDERAAFEAAYNAGWDASDACDNAYNNGTSEQLAVPGQSHEPEVFQRWRAEWFSNRDEVITRLLAARAASSATAPLTSDSDVCDAARYRWLRSWYLRGGLRAEIHPLGHIVPTTPSIIDGAIDAAIAQSTDGEQS